MKKELATILVLVPCAAFAQMNEHKPPTAIPMPTSRDLNNIGTDNSGTPTCSYVVSATSMRPRERTSAVVTLEISPSGLPLKAEVTESTGSEHLDNASEICAKSWHYKLAPQATQLAVTPVKLEIRWRAPNGPPPSPYDDEMFVGRPVLDGTPIVDLGL